MNKNLKGELIIMDNMKIMPNYDALVRKYGMDWRTVKKFHNDYEGKPKTRKKGSKNEIAERLQIKRLSVRGLYEFMVKKYGLKHIGTYFNFNRYIHRHELKQEKKVCENPRFEKKAGEQAQIDWKEDIKNTSG